MGDLIAYYMVKMMNRIFHVCPIRIVLFIGRSFGRMAYYLSGKRASITYANLKAAFHGEKTPGELKAITKGVYLSVGETFAELMALTKVDEKYLDKYIDINGIEKIEQAAKNPNGMILVSAHFGNWELCTAASVLKGYPLYVLARDQKMKRLNELLNMLRESKGNIIIRKGISVKTVLKVLKEGKSIGLLADQNAGPSGMMADLFGRPASTATGPYRFAQKSGAWILPAFLHRKDGPYQRLEMEEPIIVGKDDDIRVGVEKYNALLEKNIRKKPEQWFWMHKKWKLTTSKTILVLDDGKKGHLKQSLAVLRLIKDDRKNEGRYPDDIKVIQREVRFRSRFHKGALALLAPFCPKAFQLHLALIKFALTPESSSQVISEYADIVVSCGSSLYGVNALMKKENYSRNLTILDPGIFLRKKFNVVIIPAHDIRESERVGDNIAVVDLAPNAVEADEIKKAGEERGDDGRRGIGVLVGGDNDHFCFSENTADALSAGLKKYCAGNDASLYLTTSRRTPDASEKILENGLAKEAFCELFVSGKTDGDPSTVEKIMAASDVLVVSGESISMVSEAVSSGLPVVVFMPEKRSKGVSKYERFAGKLRDKGFLMISAPEAIGDSVAEALKKSGAFNFPDDNNVIKSKVYKLF